MAQPLVRSQPTYDVQVERDVMVPMRDGVRLATDLYFPAQGDRRVTTPLPVVMERTPYSKEDQRRVQQGHYFASRGYVVAFQDIRGRYKSEGSFVKYLDDGPDGFDTLQWLVQQPWCSGKVGMFGISYGAHTQTAAASLNPPGLAFCFLDSGGFANAYKYGCRNGGAFEVRQATWAFREAINSPEAAADPKLKRALEAEDIGAWFQRMPWRKGHSPLRHIPAYEDYLLELWAHEVFDDYWKQVGLCAAAHYDTYADVPHVHFGSWYDPYAQMTPESFEALSKLKQSPQFLVMGPWTHGQHDATFAGDVEFGPQATIGGNLADDYNEFRLRFFDRFLKGLDNGIDRGPRVHYFLMGGGTGRKTASGRLDHGGQWRTADAWPLPTTRSTPYYLHPDGALRTAPPERANPPTRYQFDPSHPVPTIGGNISSGQPLFEGGAYDQRESERFYGSRPPYLPLASRPDVLVFQTDPLEEDVVITGPITVELWASSSAVDTDFTAKLIDVYPASDDYPQGFAMNLCDGIIRARFRSSWERPELLEPGKVEKFTIELYPTANRFVRGHRIRLDISSSNFPRFDVNPNTGENPTRTRLKRTATNAVFHDPDHPSHITLPVQPQ